MNSITHARKRRNRNCQCVAETHTDLCKVVIMQWEDARCKTTYLYMYFTHRISNWLQVEQNHEWDLQAHDNLSE